MISLPLLQSANACAQGLAWFAEHFPNGGTWSDVIAALGDHPNWSAWLGQNGSADVPGATWEARLALQRNAEDRARLGRCCPADVEGATWEARLAVQRNTDERAWLGQCCPDGVEGATPEARKAVQ